MAIDRDRLAAMSTPLLLRPYQSATVDELRRAYAAGYWAPLLQLPTGGGKTIVFAEIIRSAQNKGRRVLVLVHRRELIRQACAKLDWAGVRYGVIAPGFPPDPTELVQVGSVPTLRRRLAAIPEFDLIVLDEAHHGRAKTWLTIIRSQPQARLLGVTATSIQLDGKGLGIDAGGIFDVLICGPTVRQLIDEGYLSPARVFVPQRRLDLAGLRVRGGDYVPSDLATRIDQPEIAGDAIEYYRRFANHRPAIAFCATVAHAEHVAATFCAAGYRSACVHGALKRKERDWLIAGLGTGEIEVLTSCDLICEGLDVPTVGAVILLRPTKSLVIHLQQIGRGMRPAPDKSALIVLDHVSNTLKHGLPDLERVWTLDGIEKNQGDAPAKACPQCSAVCAADAEECHECGHEFDQHSGRRRAPTEVPDDLDEITAERLAAVLAMPYRLVVNSRLSERELREYARHRGYRPGWVWYRLREQAEVTP